MSDQRLFLEPGHPSMATYGYASFELGRFKLNALLKLAREGPGLPTLDQGPAPAPGR